MVCTINEFYCIRQTAPAVIIKVDESQLLSTTHCRDGMNFIAGKYTCTDYVLTATVSASSSVSATLSSDQFHSIMTFDILILFAIGILIGYFSLK